MAQPGIQKNLDCDLKGAILDFKRHLNSFLNNVRLSRYLQFKIFFWTMERCHQRLFKGD